MRSSGVQRIARMGLGALGFCSLAFGQEPPAPASQVPDAPSAAKASLLADEDAAIAEIIRLGTIVVTAQKRAQYQKDVPMSISALTGAHLEENGQRTFTDYAPTVPALNFASLGDGQSRINLRGMQSITGVATVAYFVDGVSQGLDTGSADVELFDIDRVEVLRGPQGTLYGEGAVGGAIKIISMAPNVHSFESRVSGMWEHNVAGGASNDGNLMLNLPLVKEVLALRVVGFRRDSEGYITLREPDQSAPAGLGLKDYSSLNIVRENANDQLTSGGRAALTWLPTASEDLVVTARYGAQVIDQGAASAISPSLEPQFGKYNLSEGGSSAASDSVNLRYRQGSLAVNWNLPSVALESISGYARIQQDNQLPTFVRFDLAPGATVGDMINNDIENTTRIFTQELRAQSVGEGPLKWTGGLFYKENDGNTFRHVTPGPNIAALDPANAFGVDSITQFTKASHEYAAYGEGEYAFTPRWSLIIGGRYFHEKLSTVFQGSETPNTFNDFSPKLGLAWRLDPDLLLYGTIVKGFRSGGVNIPAIPLDPGTLPQGFDPDHVWSYEAGVNSMLMDRQLSFGAAVFFAKWQHLQEDLLVTNALGQSEVGTTNAGQAHSAGLEFELTALLPMHLTATFGGAYLHSALDQDGTNPNIPGGVIPEGTRLENVPLWSGSASLEQNLPLNGKLNLASGAIWSYRGRTHANILSPQDSISQPYRLLNLRVGVKQKQGKWEAGLFLDNAFDVTASSFSFQDLDVKFILPPRTVGIRAMYSF